MSTPRISGYELAEFLEGSAELARLREQAAVVARAELAALRKVGFPRAGRVLDLGCGPGFFAERLRESEPGLDLTGVDRDPRCVEEARQRIVALVADAERPLPFPDAHFDAAYARLVLRHLACPRTALDELFRVVRPGGLIVAIDGDDGALVLSPEPDGFELALRARQRGVRRRGADPLFARRLPALLRGIGCEGVTLEPLVVDSISIGAAAFARIVLLPITDAIDEDLLPRAQLEAAAASVRTWGEREGVFGMTTALVVAGRKPA